MASIIAHELEEAVTDPDLNAWYDNAARRMPISALGLSARLIRLMERWPTCDWEQGLSDSTKLG